MDVEGEKDGDGEMGMEREERKKSSLLYVYGESISE